MNDPRRLHVLDAASLCYRQDGDHISVHTADGRFLAHAPGTLDNPEDVYALLGTARAATVTVADSEGQLVAADLGLYIPRVGLVSTASDTFRTGRLLLPVDGITGRVTAHGLRLGRTALHPRVEVDATMTGSAFAVYAT